MIGDILQELRKDRHLTQADLAKIVGVAPSTIGAYELETVEPPSGMLVKLADYFGVSLDYLVGRSRVRITLDELLLDFPTHDKTTLKRLIELLDKMGSSERQAFWIVSEGLAIRGNLNCKNPKR